MATCTNCGSYYRLSPFHRDNLYCEDCAYTKPQRFELDDESVVDIQQLVNPSGKTTSIRYAEDDSNEMN